MKTFVALLVLTVTGTVAAAPVRYDYLGQEFTGFTDVAEVSGSYTAGMRVSGYFVLADALAADTTAVIAIADMIDFSFSDGRNTITEAQTNLPTSIQISTDAQGDIFLWDINLNTSFDQPEPGGEQSWQIWTRTNFDGTSSTDSGTTSVCISFVPGEDSRPCLGSYDDSAIIFQGAPGTWSATVVPIPAAVWLFGSGLGLLGWLHRRSLVS